MEVDQHFKQIKRRRGTAMKLIRQGHEKQEDRLNDTLLQALMQDVGHNMSPKQIMTMLQDLLDLNYVRFDQSFDEEKERFIAERIMLTALGAALVLRRQDNENVLFC